MKTELPFRQIKSLDILPKRSNLKFIRQQFSIPVSMRQDEAETLKTLTAYCKIMGELIQQHRGRVLDSSVDNILAEFASVRDSGK